MDAEREFTASLCAGIWCTEAKACTVCGEPWTEERLSTRNARVVSVTPRRLACNACFEAVKRAMERMRETCAKVADHEEAHAREVWPNDHDAGIGMLVASNIAAAVRIVKEFF